MKNSLLTVPLIMILFTPVCGQSQEPISQKETARPIQTPVQQAAAITGKPMAEMTGKMTGEMASPTAASPDGKLVFDKICVACHGQGIAGAPKVGDPQAWKPHIAKGLETLFDHAIHGYTGEKGTMPAKGGDPSLSDAEVEAAVRYMVEQSR